MIRKFMELVNSCYCKHDNCYNSLLDELFMFNWSIIRLELGYYLIIN